MLKQKIYVSILSLCVVLTFSPIVQADTAVSFWPSRLDLPVGDAYGIESADFNNDAKPDLAVISNSSNVILILLNNGRGSYVNSGNTTGFANMGPMTAGDFNRDGNVDLAVINFSTSRVQLFLGNGQGRVVQGNNFAVSNTPSVIAAQDFNNDQNIDLVVNGNSNIVELLLGDGQGGFPNRQNVTVALSNVVALMPVDLNNDGKKDLITRSNLSVNLSVVLGNGNGTFNAPATYPTGLSSFINSMANADFNCDGVADLVVVGDKFSIMFGNGQGGFSTPRVTNEPYDAIAITDLNRDGDYDLVLTKARIGAGGDLTVYLGQMNGSFIKDKIYLTGRVPAFMGRKGIVSDDVNSDSNADLTFLNFTAGPGFVSVLLGDGTGKLRNSIEVDLGTTPYFFNEVSSADFNNDGKADMVINSGNSLEVFLGDGQGHFSGGNSTAINFLSRNRIGGDYNRDGNQDLILTGPTSPNNYAIYTMLGNGNGTFNLYALYPSFTNEFEKIVKGDFNNDQKEDLLILDNSYIAPPQNVSLFFGDGLGGFSPNGAFPVGQQSRDITVADLNNDSNQDWIVVNTASGNFSVYLGNGQGGFTNVPNTFSLNFPVALTAGDLNGDGRADLAIVFGNTTSSVRIFLGNGTGGFLQGNSYEVGTFPEKIILLDSNNDGLKDIVTLNKYSHNLSLLLGDGSGGFAGAQHFGTATYPQSMAVADFDSDGKIDIASVGENKLSLLFNNLSNVYVGLSTNLNQPPPGGTMLNTLRVSNVTALPQTFDFHLVTILPNNTVRPELSFPNLVMAPNKELNLTFPWTIPANTPLGDYSLKVIIGTTSGIWDTGLIDYKVKIPVYCPN